MRTHWAYVGIAPVTVVILSYLLQTLEFNLSFPVFRYLIYNQENGILDLHASVSERSRMLFVALTVFYAGQLLLTPIVGSLTDYFGRRKLFLISLAIWLVCFFLTAISVYYHSIPLFLITRFFGGSLVAYRPLVLSVLSDIYPTSFSRQRAIAFFSGCDGLACAFFLFITGRVFYGVLDPIGSTIFYFCLSGVVAICNFFFIYTNLPETFPNPHSLNRYWPRFLRSFKAISKVPQIKLIILLSFFTYSAMMLLIFAKVEFSVDAPAVSMLFYIKLISLGITWALASAIFVPYLVKILSPQKIYLYSFPYMLFIWIITFIFPAAANSFWHSALSGFLMGILWPVLLMLGTWRVPHEFQGTVQGILQFFSTCSLIMAHLHINLTMSPASLQLIILGFMAISFLLFWMMRFDPEYAEPLENSF
jgi:DHA1 family tetracycline resistance protein-like MFS transporter